MSTSFSPRLFGSNTPTGLIVTLAQGAQLAHVRQAISAMAGSGLQVLSDREWVHHFVALAGQGLGQLQWIALMLEIAAILALAAALTADLWQQRYWAADLRLSNVPPHRLRRIMLLKASLAAGSGCLAGVLGGMFGQAIADSYLKQVTGFPVAGLASGALPLETFALVLGAALLIAAPVVWRVSHVPLALGLEAQ